MVRAMMNIDGAELFIIIALAMLLGLAIYKGDWK